MQNNKIQKYIENVIENMPNDWLNLTTHRLDIYDEELAKTQFLKNFENLFNNNIYEKSALANLPTAYDYIRLGHPLSCILEWSIAKNNDLPSENIISFDSKTMPILAVLRSNLLLNKPTRINYVNELPDLFDVEKLKTVYGYKFELKKVKHVKEVHEFEGSNIFIDQNEENLNFNLSSNIDFYINYKNKLGSILLINGKQNEKYVSEIQHVRRRETIAMTPKNTLRALNSFVKKPLNSKVDNTFEKDKKNVLQHLKKITGTITQPLVSSSGLSIQYAIMMGLIDDAQNNYKGKKIKFIVPPNCYGGTNDQARRVAACIKNVEIVDLPVDGDNDMIKSIDTVLNKIANENAVPFIIAEIPTNPRVEVPNLVALKKVLNAKRKTSENENAIAPVFILDQTFCPNVHFLGENETLSDVKSISYASGSKFPSGGKCTAGYCVANENAAYLMNKIESHLNICDNEATDFQYKILAEQLPSMTNRIYDAYKNTREFVSYIQKVLPEAKINFVSKELATLGFTPSVFSLDLPTKGTTEIEKENYKRTLNLKLIHLMISEIPDESKFCVSYGQLKGCYWTVPATSTQGTTKEGDKDYIVRVSVSPNLDLEKHKNVFLDFVKQL
ncbi:cystathionine beta-synthase [Polaribacter aestuariivivens]|uniref:Cystathionine beta-synthase n=1 Tax=Polaribacter aestuariivivens TaxID=2304626 RepID=A0A5S3N6W8_9FLAO|nr:cystathionine beta-synthase [Polaribacter aestuariivivens]TMM31010.1 cystathionine beta-synthase [Polaribacter aestuariivivens]